MGKLVTPKAYLIGMTCILDDGLMEYLRDSGNEGFRDYIKEARAGGVSDGEILCSFYGKLCYASLTLGKNQNVSRIRDITSNFKGILASGHGSVLEHCQINFVVRNCSRVFTHELVRHRVGTAFSQTSGRYVRGDSLDIVFDPILEPVKEEVQEVQSFLEERYQRMVQKLELDKMQDFDKKKKLTSALRRFLPNGQSNEIGFSVNLRTLRHVVMLRTSRHAEWEIRHVFEQVYLAVLRKFPLIFCDARESQVDGALEISGMKIQPWERFEEAV